MKFINYNYTIGYPLQAARFLNDDTLLVAGGSPETGNKITALKINFQKKKVVKRYREIVLDTNDDLPTTLDVANVSKGPLTNIILLGCNEILDPGFNYENTPNHHLRKFYFEDDHLKFIASADFNKSMDPKIHTKLTSISRDTTVGATASSAIPTIIKIIDPKTMEEKYEIETGRDVKDLHFSKDGKMICYITETTLEVISIVTGKFIIRKTDFNKNWLLKNVRFLNNESVLIAGTQKNDKPGIILATVNIKSKNPKIIKSKNVANRFNGISSLDIDNKSEMVTFATDDGSVHIIKVSNFAILKTYKNVHQSTITSINFAPNSLAVTTVSLDKTINVIQLKPNLATSTSFFYKLYKLFLNLILFSGMLFFAYIIHHYNLHIKSCRYIYDNYISEKNISSYFQMHDNNNKFVNDVEIKREIIDDIVTARTLTKPVDTISKSIDTRNVITDSISISLDGGFKPTFSDSDSSLSEYLSNSKQNKKKATSIISTTTTTSTSFITESSNPQTVIESESQSSYSTTGVVSSAIKSLTTGSSSLTSNHSNKLSQAQSIHKKFTMNGIVYEAVSVAEADEKTDVTTTSTSIPVLSSSSTSTPILSSSSTPIAILSSSSTIESSVAPSPSSASLLSSIGTSLSSSVLNQSETTSIDTFNTSVATSHTPLATSLSFDNTTLTTTTEPLTNSTDAVVEKVHPTQTTPISSISSDSQSADNKTTIATTTTFDEATEMSSHDVSIQSLQEPSKTSQQSTSYHQVIVTQVQEVIETREVIEEIVIEVEEVFTETELMDNSQSSVISVPSTNSVLDDAISTTQIYDYTTSLPISEEAVSSTETTLPTNANSLPSNETILSTNENTPSSTETTTVISTIPNTTTEFSTLSSSLLESIETFSSTSSTTLADPITKDPVSIAVPDSVIQEHIPIHEQTEGIIFSSDISSTSMTAPTDSIGADSEFNLDTIIPEETSVTSEISEVSSTTTTAFVDSTHISSGSDGSQTANIDVSTEIVMSTEPITEPIPQALESRSLTTNLEPNVATESIVDHSETTEVVLEAIEKLVHDEL